MQEDISGTLREAEKRWHPLKQHSWHLHFLMWTRFCSWLIEKTWTIRPWENMTVLKKALPTAMLLPEYCKDSLKTETKKAVTTSIKLSSRPYRSWTTLSRRTRDTRYLESTRLLSLMSVAAVNSERCMLKSLRHSRIITCLDLPAHRFLPPMQEKENTWNCWRLRRPLVISFTPTPLWMPSMTRMCFRSVLIMWIRSRKKRISRTKMFQQSTLNGRWGHRDVFEKL